MQTFDGAIFLLLVIIAIELNIATNYLGELRDLGISIWVKSMHTEITEDKKYKDKKVNKGRD